MAMKLNIKLTNPQRQHLEGLARDPGFDVLGLVFQAVIISTQQEMTEADSNNPVAVVNAQIRAKAVKDFVAAVADLMAFEITELNAQDSPDIEMDPPVIDLTSNTVY